MHNSLTALLTQVRDGSISVADAALQLREAPFEDLGYARVDHHRRLRQGAAEVIYGAGKTPEQIAGIVDSLQRSGQKTVLITRMKPVRSPPRKASSSMVLGWGVSRLPCAKGGWLPRSGRRRGCKLPKAPSSEIPAAYNPPVSLRLTASLAQGGL